MIIKEVKMKTNQKKDRISKQLDEIQTLLQKKDSKPLNFIEAAQYLSISHSTLYKLTYQRKISCHKPNGKYLYFYKHELDEWIAGNGKEQSKSPHPNPLPKGEGEIEEDESG